MSWTVSGPGTLTNETATGVTYNAPSSVSSSSNATVTATSVASSTATAQLSITVNPDPQVTTTSLPAAPEYNAYSATLKASGGTGGLTWKVSSGSLPAWASLNASTGVLSGTPNATGTSNFSVSVTDADSVTSASQALSLTVNPPPALAITTSSLPNGTAGTTYSATVQATGGYGAYTWSISSGALPTGITLDASTGVISGQTNSSGVSSFTVKVTDSEPTPASTTKAFTITMAAPPALAITTSSLPNGTAGTSYSATLQASGGISPYSWSISSGSLPAWATLDSSTGVISGMPNAAGTTSFTVKVTDSESPTVSVTEALSITIAAPPALTISTTSLPSGNENTAYTTTLAATGGVQPYTWSISSGALPSWATLDASTGVISGTPNATGTTSFTVQVTDSEATPVSATQALSITINAAAGTNDAELKGQYGFLLQGFDDATGQQFAITGSFIADGSGNISGGMFDVNGPSPASAVSVSSGSYSVGSDNRGTLTLHGSDGSSRTFAIAVGAINSGVANKASMIEFDDTTGTTGDRGAGTIHLQDTADFSLSSIKGPYAFEFVGEEGTPGTRLVNIGAFTADGSGNITNGEMDSNATGTVSNGSFTATISTDANTSTYGRVTMTLGGGPTGTGVIYIDSASRLLAMTLGTEATSGLESGEMLSQSTTSFSTSSLNGTSVFYGVGLGSTTGDSDTQAGLVSFNGSGTASFTGDENDSGTTGTNSGTVTYTVASNGRVTIGGSNQPPIFYLISNNKGFMMNTDNHVDAGIFEPQSAGTFSNASISGDYFYGNLAPAVTATGVASGVATSTGSGTLSATQDVSGPDGTLTTGESLSFTLTVASNGRATDNHGDILYIISPTKVVSFNSTNTTGTVTVAQQ